MGLPQIERTTIKLKIMETNPIGATIFGVIGILTLLAAHLFNRHWTKEGVKRQEQEKQRQAVWNAEDLVWKERNRLQEESELNQRFQELSDRITRLENKE